jgi:cyclopropane-fatty-acyl-phospholipid synthase
MSSKAGNQNSKDKERTVHLLEELFLAEGAPPVDFRLWDGSCWPGDAVSSSARIVLNHPGALRAMFLPGHELGIGEAYLYDDFDIEGTCEDVFDLYEAIAKRTSDWLVKLKAAKDLLSLPADGEHPWLRTNGNNIRRLPFKLTGNRHSQERDRQAVTFHYNVSNEFYKLWLDRRMVYSAAYFQSPEEDLDTAQAGKLDYICRKLRLQAGQKFLDIGCGWGALVIHAADRYGADATGITLSEPQAELANKRIAEAGLRNHCRVLVADYREVDEKEKYDALASVGMFEHVGEALLPVYFRQAYDLLKPGGVFLNHGIVRRMGDIPRSARSFVDTYVFPDGELIPISVILKAAEDAGFEIRDLESLREHYAMTLRHWVRRLEKAHDDALKYVDEPTYRTWRLYMSGSANGFIRGRINVYQALLSKQRAQGASGLPLTRVDWYPSTNKTSF